MSLAKQVQYLSQDTVQDPAAPLGLKYKSEKKAPVEIAGAWYKQASYWAT